jgi:sugar-specific transcriptional regulator TrmB
MDVSVLEGLGLSKNEIIVFVKLVEIGESKSGTIISQTGLQSSAIYNALLSLIEKGLISYIKKNGIKYYKSAEPETLIDYIETKKREVLKIIPSLKQKKVSKEENNMEFFESYRGIKSLLFELLKDAKKQDVYRYFAPETKYYNLSTEKVYSAEKHIRIEKKIKTKAIYPEDSRSVTRKTKTTEKRYTKQKLPPNTSIFNNKVAIISWGEKPFGVLIRSKEVYEQYVSFFEDVWERAKE